MPFEVQITDQDNNTETIVETFTVPEIVSVTLDAEPFQTSTTPNTPIDAILTITSTGNVPAQNIPLTLDTSAGLNVSGLPGTISLGLGESQTIPLTLTPTANTPLNSTLSATVTARFGADLDGNPFESSTSIIMNVRSNEVLPIEQTAILAAESGNDQLAQTLSTISAVTGQLQLDSGNTTLCNRLAHAYDQLLQLADVNPDLSGRKSEIQGLRDLAAACNTAPLLSDAAQFFTDLPITPVLVVPKITFVLSDLNLAPGQDGELMVRLENPSDQPANLSLSIDALPSGVNAQLNRTNITLAPGEILDAASANPVKISLNQSLASNQVFSLKLSAIWSAFPSVQLTATSLVSVSESLADVVDVIVDPALIDGDVTSANVQIQILNTANNVRSVQAKLEIVDQNNALVNTLPNVPLLLEPTSDEAVFDLGAFPVTGLSDGAYRMRVSLLADDGISLPGRSTQGLFYVGALITADVFATPTLVAPGNPSVTSTLQITNQAALFNGAGNTEKMIQYHTADAIVDALSDLANVVGDPQTVLGSPQPGNFVSLNGGTLVLDLGPDANLAFDGPTDDFMILENGDDESYDVEVSLDGTDFTLLGSVTGIARFDLEASGLSQVRYIRIVDQGNLTGAAPGADIEGLRVFNAEGGIKIERVDHRLGTEGFSRRDVFDPSGVIATPIVANIDNDPTPEILISTDSFATDPKKRFFALDGLTGTIDLEIQDIRNSWPAVAVAELDPSSPGPEIVLPSGISDSLNLLSSTGNELWSVRDFEVSPVIANIDSDPEAEIIMGNIIAGISAYDHLGQRKWQSDTLLLISQFPSAMVAADLDNDGIAEVISTTRHNSVIALKSPAVTGPSAIAEILWQTPIEKHFFGGPAVADIDGALGGDTDPEIIIASDTAGRGLGPTLPGDGFINILNHDGTLLKRIKFDGWLISPPTIADINADGLTDIVFSEGGRDMIHAISLTAEILSRPEQTIPIADVLLWSASAPDKTESGSGISVYDLDGDGIWEVVWNGFGADETQKTGGLSIFSGLDGRLIYQNPRINSGTLDENVTIADIDGDGHAELITGDQEGLWIIGADDLWVGSRDIWNQQSYHVTNINADLTVPAQETPSWLDHNTYRTQRPPTGTINRLELEITHLLPSAGYTIDGIAVTPEPDNISTAQVDWTAIRSFNDPSRMSFTLPGTVDDMAPGESREISRGSQITARFIDDNNQQINTTLTLPPLVVAAAHIIDLEPPNLTSNTGEETNFNVLLTNPSDINQTYTLNTIGLEGLNPTLGATVSVPAGQTIPVPLTINIPSSATGEHAFSVQVTTVTGVVDNVQGALTILGGGVIGPGGPPIPVDLETLAVDLQITPINVTAGQSTAAKFTARVTNTGDETAIFDISGNFPPGFVAELSETRITLLPGLTNFRDVQLTLTPPTGTAPGSHPFTVKAIATNDAAINDQAGGNVNVLDLGVNVTLSPQSGSPDSLYQLTVTNTGLRTDTYNIALAGPVALFATLSVNSVTLPPKTSRTFQVSVGAIDKALPGSLALNAIAISKSDNAVQNSASANISIIALRGVNAEFDPTSVVLPSPGQANTGLRIHNTGNVEDAYTAVITSTSGPFTANLIGLDQQPTQTIAIFRLPAQSSGLISLNTELLQAESGQVSVTVTSLSDASINDNASYNVNSQQGQSQGKNSTAIPTLNPMALLLLMMLMAAVGEFYRRRRERDSTEGGWR